MPALGRGRRLTMVGVLTLGAVALGACAPSGTVATGTGASSASPAIPLVSATVAGTTAWATLGLSRPDAPGRPRWPLLSLAAGSSWQVTTPPGLDRGAGLVASATALPASVLAGTAASRPGGRSPVARRTAPASEWEAGHLPDGLTRVPDALAQGGTETIGLLGPRRGTVVVSTGDLSAWRPLTTGRSLARDPALAGCRLRALTAVTVDADAIPLLGASCAAGGRAGLFASSATGWQSSGPGIPGVTGGPTEVVRLDLTSAGTSALVSAGSGLGVRLYAMWSTNRLRTWTVSAGLSLDGAALVSTGVTGPGGFVVATRASGYGPTAAFVTPTGVQWQMLPAPPSGTASVTATPSGGFDALVPARAALSVYSLGRGRWGRVQTLSAGLGTGR